MFTLRIELHLAFVILYLGCVVFYGPLPQRLDEPGAWLGGAGAHAIYTWAGERRWSGVRSKPPADKIYQVIYGQGRHSTRPGQCVEELEPLGDPIV